MPAALLIGGNSRWLESFERRFLQRRRRHPLSENRSAQNSFARARRGIHLFLFDEAFELLEICAHALG